MWIVGAAVALTVAHSLKPDVDQAVAALNRISEVLDHGSP